MKSGNSMAKTTQKKKLMNLPLGHLNFVLNAIFHVLKILRISLSLRFISAVFYRFNSSSVAKNISRLQDTVLAAFTTSILFHIPMLLGGINDLTLISWS